MFDDMARVELGVAYESMSIQLNFSGFVAEKIVPNRDITRKHNLCQ